MTGFDELLALAAAPRSEKLTDVIAFWREAIEQALKESTAKPAAKGLKAGLAKASKANLGVMRAMSWKPDSILEQMFSRKEKSREAWSKELATQVGIKDAPGMLKWWQAAEGRLLEESQDAFRAAEQTQDTRLLKAVEAFIGESFAACVIAQAPLGEDWESLVEA